MHIDVKLEEKEKKKKKNVCTASEIRVAGLDITAHTNHSSGTPITLHRIGQFPVDRRPQQRELVAVDQAVINQWFDNSGITIGRMANTLEKQNLSKRLLYTWQECFAKTLRDVKPTDLIEHSIDLKPNAHVIRKKNANFVTASFQK